MHENAPTPIARSSRAVGEKHHPKSVQALVYDLVKGVSFSLNLWIIDNLKIYKYFNWLISVYAFQLTFLIDNSEKKIGTAES